MKPVAWRDRHDAFARACRNLRRTGPQGPQPEGVAALAEAVEQHAVYEETVLWPRYAEVAPEEGPGCLRALHRDHALLRSHLSRAAHPDPLCRAWALARLEGVLEHHDRREATYVLPALESLGVQVDLEEAPLLDLPLKEVPPLADDPGWRDWPTALSRLALAQPAVLPPAPDLPKAQRIRAAFDEAIAREPEELPARRDAYLDAFDRALELAWMMGQAREPWVQALRSGSPTTDR